MKHFYNITKYVLFLVDTHLECSNFNILNTSRQYVDKLFVKTKSY